VVQLSAEKNTVLCKQKGEEVAIPALRNS